MNVKDFEKKEKSTAEFTVEFSAEEFEAAVEAAYKKNKSKIALPGFRKGKAPRKLIENMYGKEVFYEDAIEILYPDAFENAVSEQKLEVVGRPSIVDVKFENGASIKFGVALYPEVTIGEYKGVEAVKPSEEVSDEAVDEDIKSTQKRNARIQTVDREAASGDTANIDYLGTRDGVPFDGGKAEGYDLVLGSGQFVPGFEDQVIGMKAGEEKDIDITFPENYAADLAGAAVVFHVKCNEVKESILPELDDEFAKDVSEFDTLEEYKADVKAKLTERKKAQADAAFKENVMDKMIDTIQGDIPEAMIEEQIDNTIQNYSYNLQQQGMSFDQYLQMMGTTAADFRKFMRPGAEKQIKAELVLGKIADTEKFELTDEELENEYKETAERFGTEVENVKKYVSADAIKKQLSFKKAEDLLYASAVATAPVEEKAE